MTFKQQRARRFEHWLQRYDMNGSLIENLVDILVDARHWCDHQGQCIAQVDRLAHRHYLAERWDAARRRK